MNGSWAVEFDIVLDGKDARWDDLSEETKEHILEAIRNDFYYGEIVEEDNYEC